jgi:predicted RecA/RadA family phage recombinase
VKYPALNTKTNKKENKMAREANLREGSVTENVVYNNASAVSAGEVVYVASLGALVASNTYDASADGVYYRKGIFQFPITTGVSVTQGARCYWDVSANKVILSTSTSYVAGTDFYLGRAVAAGSASGGYVDIEINNNMVDVAGMIVPAGVVVLAGLQTCVNITLVTNATLETILATTTVVATDNAHVILADQPSDATCRVIWAKCNAGSITVGLSTPVKASAPTERLSYTVIRAVS